MFAASKCNVAVVAVLAVVASAAPAFGLVNLEWRPDVASVPVGGALNLGLYTVSDSAVSQDWITLDLAFSWDPAKLMLIGVDDTGGASLMASGFAPGGLNEAVPPADGTGLYTAMANFGEVVTATPAGTLVTTFNFSALELTTGTSISIEAILDSIETAVGSAAVAGEDIKGTLGTARVVVITPEPSAALLILLGLAALPRSRRRA